MLIPSPRGELSAAVVHALTRRPGEGPGWPAPSSLEDAAVALWMLHELHYRGFDGVDDALEWSPRLVGLRVRLERDFEDRLRSRYEPVLECDDFATALFALIAHHEGPSIARFVQKEADARQVCELLRWRSIYHLKETDPAVWVLPRLPVATQAALQELLFDEYGAGSPHRHHGHLFARGLEAIGLDPTHGAYLDEAPLEILEQNNAMTMFGLHRRLRGAALGHLAAFEVTSSGPSSQLVQGLERLDFPPEIRGYYAEHVAADAVHEQLAVRTICASLVAAEPAVLPEVFFGAFTCLDLEDRLAHHALARWRSEQDEAVA